MKKFLKDNISFIIIVMVIVTLSYVKLPYYIDTPGGIINISDRISIDDEEVSVNGSLNMLYVSEYVATVPTYLLSFVVKDWDRESIKESQVSNESSEEIYKRGRIMLDNSLDNAMYVAYTKAGRDISIKGYENVVIATTIDSNIEIGDRILEVNDIKIESVKELKEIISNSDIGDELKIKVLRDDKENNIKVEVKEDNGNKVIGVVMVTDYEFDIDPLIEVNFKKSESGSSGGLMMALSIYNAISDEDIIKGRNIAGTGTISMDGSVGEIAGIKYKIMGAVSNNMDLVLVPKGNYEEALKVKEEKGYDIDIVMVDTFDDAIEYLRSSK